MNGGVGRGEGREGSDSIAQRGEVRIGGRWNPTYTWMGSMTYYEHMSRDLLWMSHTGGRRVLYFILVHLCLGALLMVLSDGKGKGIQDLLDVFFFFSSFIWYLNLPFLPCLRGRRYVLMVFLVRVTKNTTYKMLLSVCTRSGFCSSA